MFSILNLRVVFCDYLYTKLGNNSWQLKMKAQNQLKLQPPMISKQFYTQNKFIFITFLIFFMQPLMNFCKWCVKYFYLSQSVGQCFGHDAAVIIHLCFIAEKYPSIYCLSVYAWVKYLYFHGLLVCTPFPCSQSFDYWMYRALTFSNN